MEEIINDLLDGDILFEVMEVHEDGYLFDLFFFGLN